MIRATFAPGDRVHYAPTNDHGTVTESSRYCNLLFVHFDRDGWIGVVNKSNLSPLGLVKVAG